MGDGAGADFLDLFDLLIGDIDGVAEMGVGVGLVALLLGGSGGEGEEGSVHISVSEEDSPQRRRERREEGRNLTQITQITQITGSELHEGDYTGPVGPVAGTGK